MEEENYVYILKNESFTPIKLILLRKNRYKNIYIRNNSGNESNNKCSIIKNDIEYVLFSWENIKHFSTDLEKNHFNLFRLKYYDILAKKVSEKIECFSKEMCSFILVGTVDNITSESDIDVNFVFSMDNIVSDRSRIEQIIQNIHAFYKYILEFHDNYFSDSLENTFDINFYASSFITDGKILNNCSEMCIESPVEQKYFAFIRAIDAMSHNKISASLIKKSIIKLKSKELGKLFLEKKNSKTYHDYVKSIKKYLISENSNNISSNTVFNKFSITKLKERDTYRSVGAFLHIVKKLKDMHPSFYLDSFLDNYGFMLENLFHKPDCFNLEIDLRLRRVSKYICRMVDALIKYNVKLESKLKNVNKLSCKINTMRKKNKNTTKEVAELFHILSNKKLNNNNNTEEVWFQCTTEYFFKFL